MRSARRRLRPPLLPPLRRRLRPPPLPPLSDDPDEDPLSLLPEELLGLPRDEESESEEDEEEEDPLEDPLLVLLSLSLEDDEEDDDEEEEEEEEEECRRRLRSCRPGSRASCFASGAAGLPRMSSGISEGSIKRVLAWESKGKGG